MGVERLQGLWYLFNDKWMTPEDQNPTGSGQYNHSLANKVFRAICGALSQGNYRKPPNWICTELIHESHRIKTAQRRASLAAIPVAQPCNLRQTPSRAAPLVALLCPLATARASTVMDWVSGNVDSLSLSSLDLLGDRQLVSLISSRLPFLVGPFSQKDLEGKEKGNSITGTKARENPASLLLCQSGLPW